MRLHICFPKESKITNLQQKAEAFPMQFIFTMVPAIKCTRLYIFSNKITEKKKYKKQDDSTIHIHLGK